MVEKIEKKTKICYNDTGIKNEEKRMEFMNDKMVKLMEQMEKDVVEFFKSVEIGDFLNRSEDLMSILENFAKKSVDICKEDPHCLEEMKELSEKKPDDTMKDEIGEILLQKFKDYDAKEKAQKNETVV